MSGWVVGEEVILRYGSTREVRTVERVTPAGLCKLTGDDTLFMARGRARGAGAWTTHRIDRPEPGQADAVRAENALRFARRKVRSEVETRIDKLTLDQCRAILAAMEVE